MTCKRCEERGHPASFGSAPKCAFEEGEFSSDNWNCATMNELRAIAEEREVWNQDQYCSIIPVPESEDDCGEFLVLGWYKHRGKTEAAWVIDEDWAPTRLDLPMAERILEGRRAMPAAPSVGKLNWAIEREEGASPVGRVAGAPPRVLLDNERILPRPEGASREDVLRIDAHHTITRGALEDAAEEFLERYKAGERGPAFVEGAQGEADPVSVGVDQLPCPHGRPGWQMCPHCNGLNAAPKTQKGESDEAEP